LTPEIPSPNSSLGVFLLGFAPFLVHAGAQTCLRAKMGTRACLRVRLGIRAYLNRIVARFTDASLVRVPLQVGIDVQRGTSTGLRGTTIEGHAVKDGLCLEALLTVNLSSSRAGDAISLGALDLARCLLLLRLLCFRFLTAFLVSCLSVIGVGLLDLSRPHRGSIEFDNGNSVRMGRGPIVKTIWTFLLAVSIPCLTTMVMGSY